MTLGAAVALMVIGQLSNYHKMSGRAAVRLRLIILPVLLPLVLISANQLTTDKALLRAVGKDHHQSCHCNSNYIYNVVFYMHDVPVSSDPSSVPVAGGNLTSSPGLGLTMVFDDVLTDGPSLADSIILGAGQGTYVLASKTSPDLLLVFTAVFRGNSSFSGSTLSFQGSDRILLPVREIAVVGGTGLFQFARGVAAIETASSSGFNAVLKFNVSIII